MKPPLSRTVRRCIALALGLYALVYCRKGWLLYSDRVKMLDIHKEHHHLKNVVDRILDEVASDLLLADRSFGAKPSRKNLKNILNLQSSLSRAIDEGTWQHGSPGQRPSPLFVPIIELLPRSKHVSNESSLYANICESLSGKRTALIGPETTFYLHSLWLASLEMHEGRTHTCFGRDFCTFHHICRSLSTKMDKDVDEMIGRKKKMPSKNLLLNTKSSLLQYALSTTLHASKNQHDTEYTSAMVDNYTGIRISNAYWLRRARSADIVILNRGPLAAPTSTYNANNDPTGNWAFAKQLCSSHNHLDSDTCEETLGSRIINAALHATLVIFLPSLLSSLRGIAEDSEIMRSVLVWHGSWYIQPLCAKFGLPRNMALLREFWSHDINAMVDPWSFYYNSQVYMHDHLLPKILPHFNITYIPLTIPSYTNSSHIHGRQTSFLYHSKDCIRDPWPSFGRNLERVFLNGLTVVLSNL